MSGQYAVLYRQAREGLESEAETRLERPLNTHERNLFRSCGTLTKLEELGMQVYCAENAEELARTLAETSLESRFLLALKEIADRLGRSIGHPITDTERARLRLLGNTEELWRVEELLSNAPPAERVALFESLLPPLAQQEPSPPTKKRSVGEHPV